MKLEVVTAVIALFRYFKALATGIKLSFNNMESLSVFSAVYWVAIQIAGYNYYTLLQPELIAIITINLLQNTKPGRFATISRLS